MGNSTTVDLLGDNKSLKKALSESQQMVADFGGKVKSAFVAIGAVLAAKQIISFAAGWVSDASEAAQAFAKLQAVVKATGGTAGYTAEQMKYMADSLESVTMFESEAVQQGQAIIATFRNIRGAEFSAATEAAADMAAVLGTDLSGAATMVAKALNDPLQGITALSRAGVTFSDSQKESIAAMLAANDVAGAQQIILKELKNEYGGAAKAMAGGFAGQLKQMQTRIGDVGEELGSAIMIIMESLSPIADGVITFLENVAPIASEVATGIVAIGSEIMGSLQPVFEWLLDAGITVFTAIEMSVYNFSEIAGLAMVQFQYSVVNAFEVVKHWLTSVIPELLTWFAQNWTDIFTDIGVFIGTVLANYFKNFTDFFQGIYSYLSGDGFSFEFTALTDGFESSIKKLPEIAARIPSALESELGKSLDEAATKLADTFGNKFNEKKAFIMDALKKKEKEKVDLKNTAEKVDAKDLKQPDEKKEKKAKEDSVKFKLEDDKKEGKSEKKSEGHKASFEDAESVYKRIQSAAASSRESEPVKKLTESNKELKEGMVHLSSILNKVGNNLTNTLIDAAKATGIKPSDVVGGAIKGLATFATTVSDPGKLAKFFGIKDPRATMVSGGAGGAGQSNSLESVMSRIGDKHDAIAKEQVQAMKSASESQRATASATAKIADNIATIGTLQ